MLTEDKQFDDKPRWSQDGNRLYFTSDRDGFRCLWTLKLDPRTKRAAGKPEPLHHFHRMRQSIRNVGDGFSDIAVAGGMLIFPLDVVDGNIWMTGARSAVKE